MDQGHWSWGHSFQKLRGEVNELSWYVAELKEQNRLLHNLVTWFARPDMYDDEYGKKLTDAWANIVARDIADPASLTDDEPVER